MNKQTEEKLKAQNYIETEMIEAAFNFWFSDNNHLRSPFPAYMRDKLITQATDKFIDWTNQISDKAKKEINDEILAEKFEEIIFECALNLVLTEDEKLTIRYPFMPRIDDIINDHNEKSNHGKSKVVDRFYHKKKDTAFLKLKLKTLAIGKMWETEFELPE